MTKGKFPTGFLWGASTASHQVEGNTHNQWTAWERGHADELAQDARSDSKHVNRAGRSKDGVLISSEAQKAENYISGRGVEHYERYEEDFQLLRSLNMNAFRFSIEWSRIEPENGKWDKEAIAHYHRYIAKLHELNIEPVLTIWHWTMPTWFTDMGAFEKKPNIQFFLKYVKKIADEFGNEVRYVIILNEPNVYTTNSYQKGIWPPQKKSRLQALIVNRNLAQTHKKAYVLLKNTNNKIEVGVAMSLSDSIPISPRNPINKSVIKLNNYYCFWWFMNRIRKYQDFVGVNFYTATYYNWRMKVMDPKEPLNDLGWYMRPRSLHEVLLKVWDRYQIPIIVTENGVADAEDTYRTWWIEQTIEAMQKALAEGVELKGYLHWSLLDNFEWSSGWWPKFGLIKVSRDDMKRTVRPSAKRFAEQIQKLSSNKTANS